MTVLEWVVDQDWRVCRRRRGGRGVLPGAFRGLWIYRHVVDIVRYSFVRHSGGWGEIMKLEFG